MGLRNSTCCKTKLILKIMTIKKITLEKGDNRKVENWATFFEKCSIEEFF